GFGMGALLRLGGGPRDRAGLALTFQDTVAEAGPCASDEPELDRYLGVSLETDGASPLAHQVRFVVDQETQLLVPWNGVEAAAFVRVDDEGFARFYLGDALEPFPAWDAPPMHRSMRVLSLGGPPMRLALHGHGSGPRVTGLLVQDGGRCGDPIPEPREALGLGVVFAAGSTSDASVPAGQDPWDAQVVSEPAVVSYRGELHLFYRGRSSADAPGAIGQAVWGGDEVGFVRLGGAPVIDDDWVRQSATSELGPILDLSGPAALVRDEDGALLLYFGVSEILEDEPARSWIGGALISEDGDAIPLYRTSPSGAPTHELLSPKQGVVPSWEMSVSQPSVVQRGQGDFLMLYTGRADPVDPFTAAIGLAVSSDGVSWRRGNILPAGDPRGENQPVIRTPLESAHMTAVSSPTFVWDAHMEVFRVWYVHRAGADFSLHHALSGMDARVFHPYPGNPVLRPASFEWCDDHYLDGPSVLVEPSGLLRLYYHGRSETLGHSICYAENGFGF
ncbi:MAG: hypothetical protein RBU30_25625, partial [Polyangia bacterium]|nr:hypothetical protein [Polyangia bacterium]